jgi:hypothetical protein
MGWSSIVLTTISAVYSLSFKTSLPIQRSREYKVVIMSINIVNLIYRWLITLTLGQHSAQQCPICLVPEQYLDALGLEFPRRDTVTCKETYEKAVHARTEAEATRICKTYGICKVKVWPR